MRKYYVYVYLIITIMFTGIALVILKTDVLSKKILLSMKENICPTLADENSISNKVNEIVAPAIVFFDCETLDEFDLSYDDFAEYTMNGNIYECSDATVCDANNDESVVADNERLTKDEVTDKQKNNIKDIDGSNSDISEEQFTENNSNVADASFFGENSIVYNINDLCDFDYLVSNCYAIDNSTCVYPEELDVNKLLNKDLSIDLDGDDYKILIYHTHGSEAFCDSREGTVEDTVIGVGDELTRILEEDYGIKVYHDRTVYDVIDGELDRSYAYDVASAGVDKILEEHPSIEVVLDIHRDGVRDDVYLAKNIDGRQTAQIMFLNGMSRLKDDGDIDYLYNPNLEDNLCFSLQMHLVGKQMYGDLMRRIFVRSYCYNLDKKPRASLIEVGAQTNTVQEAKNAMIPLSAILYRVLSQK